MVETRIEWDIDYALLMEDIRRTNPSASLRVLISGSRLSAATLSRLDNGYPIDMVTFLEICNHFHLIPGGYFHKTVWERQD